MKTLPSAHALVAAILVAGALAVPGCVGYNTLGGDAADPGFKDPNSPPLPTIMRESLKFVANRYPIEDDPSAIRTRYGTVGGGPRTLPFAVSLPGGLRPNVYRTIVEGVSELARPMSPEAETLPTYYLSRIVVNGDHARADVLRPVFHIAPAAQGQIVYQGITVELRGGLTRWTVTGHREWGIGSMAVPERVYIGQDPLPPIGTEGRSAPNPPPPAASPDAPAATPEAPSEPPAPGEVTRENPPRENGG